jgi:hypothetical protein
MDAEAPYVWRILRDAHPTEERRQAYEDACFAAERAELDARQAAAQAGPTVAVARVAVLPRMFSYARACFARARTHL